MIVSVAQFDIQLFDKARNLAKMEAMARSAREQYNADLIAFPEAALAGYCFESEAEVRSVSEGRDGPAVRRMSALARELNMAVVFGMSELGEEDRLYNVSVLCLPDGAVQVYRKTHLPTIGMDQFVSKGVDIPVFDTPYGKIGLQICYDLRFPEPARVQSLKGAELIVHSTNCPPAGIVYADFFYRARASENRVFLISANRVGDERGFHFIGHSQIMDNTGKVLAAMDEFEEGIIAAEVELSLARDKDILAIPGKFEMYVFDDRRPELYGVIAGEEA